MESQESQDAGRMIKIGRAASLLGISPQTLRDWADKGMVKCTVLPSGHRRFDEEKILKLIVKGTSIKTTEKELVGRLRCGACGYWYDNDEVEMARKEEDERKTSQDVYGYYIRRAREEGDWEGMDMWQRKARRDLDDTLFLKHLVPFRALEFKNLDSLNPNFSTEKPVMRVYACPNCGTLKVNKKMEFFFEARCARQKQDEENTFRDEFGKLGGGYDPWD